MRFDIPYFHNCHHIIPLYAGTSRGERREKHQTPTSDVHKVALYPWKQLEACREVQREVNERFVSTPQDAHQRPPAYDPFNG
jgi:hypothetical protein